MSNRSYPIPAALQPYIRESSFVTRSPGRINLIGEHTDYNNGFVLPAAINKAVYLVFTPREDQRIILHSVDLKETYETSTSLLQKSEQATWPNYVLGVVEQFQLAGITVNGFEAALTGDIPIGAGLSSSAAVECATALALNAVTHARYEKIDMVKLAQRAENQFVGVQCGIMDQFASMFGRYNEVMRLDCRSLEFEYVHIEMGDTRIVLLDTGVRHSLGATEYNVRRQQCEKGVARIQRDEPGVKSLRDVTMRMLDQYLLPEDKLIYQRCKYVVEENQRLLDACEQLNAGDLAAFGRKMFGSHHGLSKEYEVSCPELDYLVEQVKDHPAVLGARMMGGGFGGCTINLVKSDQIEALVEKVAAAYQRDMHRELKAYIMEIETGSNMLQEPVMMHA